MGDSIQLCQKTRNSRGTSDFNSLTNQPKSSSSYLSKMFTGIFLLLFVVGVRSMPPIPPYSHNSINIGHRDLLGDPLRSKSFLKPASVCSLDELIAIVGIRELQELVENLAIRRGVSPFMILSKLLERMKTRQEMEESFLNTLEGAALLHLIDPLEGHAKNPSKFPLSPTETAYAYPPVLSPDQVIEGDAPIFVIPISQSSQSMSNRLSTMTQTELKLKNEAPALMSSRPHSMKAFLPSVYPLASPNRTLRPPAGATIHINSGPLANTLPDVVITVSPLMTVVEALRQAEVKYQSALGLDADNHLIRFSRSSSINCYVINRIDDVETSDVSAWKVTIRDKEGQEIYDDVCIPDGKFVKPGTLITLSYVRL